LFGTFAKLTGTGPSAINVDEEREIDVLVVGGGPVGLWTAVQIKINRPSTKIIIVEKHPEYKRGHIVSLDPQSLYGAAHHPVIEQLAKDVTENNNIRTNDIEQRLVTLCGELGILIKKNCFLETRTQLEEMFPFVPVVIGADGSHSMIRKRVFGGQMRYYEYLQFIVEVKYEVSGTTRPFNMVTEAYPTMKVMGCIATEHVGKEKEGVTPVTLRLFVDEKTLETLSEATFKNPLCLPRDEFRVNEQVQAKIKLWLQAKKLYCNEQVVPDSIKITTTKLAAYASQAFIRGEENTHFCLVGDAAFGVPFFRSLNNGLLCGTELAKETSNYLNEGGIRQSRYTDSVQGQVTEHFASYARYVKGMAWPERALARTKSVGVTSLEKWTAVIVIVPWQVFKWSYDDVQRMRADDVIEQEVVEEEIVEVPELLSVPLDETLL
jgi:2-polyprenyl-6-methoxyphenol hydroxylase-like FAD-dependent oxidoreductase